MQQTMRKKAWYSDPWLTVVLLYTLSPLVNQLVSQTVTTYFYMFVVLWTLFIIIFGKREESITRYLPIVLPFVLYGLSTYLFNTDNIIMWGYRFCLSILPVVMGGYIVKERKNSLDFMGWLTLLLLTITSLTTISGLLTYPDASRILATIADSQDEISVKYSWLNIGGYDFIYTVVLLYPLIILAWKKKKIPLVVAVALTVGVYALVILSQYTIALLLIIISTALYFVPSTFSKKGLIIMTVLGVFALIVLWGPITDFLNWLSDVLDSEIVGERLDGIAGGQEGLENLEDNRMDLYRMSLFTFLTNPIVGRLFGRYGYGIGGHSAILDMLGQYGIIGLALLILMYRSVYKNFFKEHSKKHGFGFVIWFFIQAILLSILNTGLWFFVLCVYGPLFINMIFREKKSK